MESPIKTIDLLLKTLGSILLEKNGPGFCAGYFESFTGTVARDLSREQQLELIEILAGRIAREK